VRGVINRIIDDLVARFEYRVAQFRAWRRYNSVEKGLVAVLVVAVLAALGALTAAALTGPGAETSPFFSRTPLRYRLPAAAPHRRRRRFASSDGQPREAMQPSEPCLVEEQP
jgi:hypothetical protein